MTTPRQPRPRRSVAWEIARWWVYAAVLTPIGLLVIFLAGDHGHVTAGLLIAAIAVMTVLALFRRHSAGR